MRRTVAAVAAVAAVLLAGCVPQTPPPPTPSPTPTFMCTPEAGGTEAPCSEQEYQKMKAKDSLYAEAEQVYRKFTETLMARVRAGGASNIPPELAAMISGEELADSVVKRLVEVKREGLKFKGPGVKIVWAKRLPGREKGGSVVAMTFCGDSSELVVYKAGKRYGTGFIAEETVYFSGSVGALTMASLEYKDVSKC